MRRGRARVVKLSTPLTAYSVVKQITGQKSTHASHTAEHAIRKIIPAHETQQHLLEVSMLSEMTGFATCVSKSGVEAELPWFGMQK